MSREPAKTVFFYKKVVLAVEVAVAVRRQDDLVPDDVLRGALSRYLNDWSDGRLPYHAELFRAGFGSALASSLERAVYEDACVRYPGRTTADGYSVAHKLSEAKLASLGGIHLSGDGVEVLSVETKDRVG